MKRDKNDLAVYVQTPLEVVRCMLDTAKIRPTDLLYDLGFGDGRILFSAVSPPYNARAVGIELNDERFSMVEAHVKKLGLEKRIELLYGDILDYDISDATVVTVYLTRRGNRKIKPMLERELGSNARVVSHDFEFEGWEPAKVQSLPAYEMLETPFGCLGREHMHYIYLYKMGRI